MDDRIICITQKIFEKFLKDESLQDSFRKAKLLVDRLNKRNLYKEIANKIVERRFSVEELENYLIEENNIEKNDFFIEVNKFYCLFFFYKLCVFFF